MKQLFHPGAVSGTKENVFLSLLCRMPESVAGANYAGRYSGGSMERKYRRGTRNR